MTQGLTESEMRTLFHDYGRQDGVGVTEAPSTRETARVTAIMTEWYEAGFNVCPHVHTGISHFPIICDCPARPRRLRCAECEDDHERKTHDRTWHHLCVHCGQRADYGGNSIVGQRLDDGDVLPAIIPSPRCTNCARQEGTLPPEEENT